MDSNDLFHRQIILHHFDLLFYKEKLLIPLFIMVRKLSSRAKYILINKKKLFFYFHIKRNITCGCNQPQNTTTINYTWVLADVPFYTWMWRHIKTWKIKCSFNYNCLHPDLVSILSCAHKHLVSAYKSRQNKIYI